VVTFLLIVALLIVVAVLVGFVVGYNRIRAADVRVDEALGGIDVQLTRRASLIPALSPWSRFGPVTTAVLHSYRCRTTAVRQTHLSRR
jgi:hypothetical protein